MRTNNILEQVLTPTGIAMGFLTGVDFYIDTVIDIRCVTLKFQKRSTLMYLQSAHFKRMPRRIKSISCVPLCL